MFVVVSYDVVDDKRRTKVHNTLKDFGTRVQYSVFECTLDAAKLLTLSQRLERLIDAGQDSIRMYHLCEGDVRKIRVVGRGMVARVEPYRII